MKKTKIREEIASDLSHAGRLRYISQLLATGIIAFAAAAYGLNLLWTDQLWLSLPATLWFCLSEAEVQFLNSARTKQNYLDWLSDKK